MTGQQNIIFICSLTASTILIILTNLSPLWRWNYLQNLRPGIKCNVNFKSVMRGLPSCTKWFDDFMRTKTQWIMCILFSARVYYCDNSCRLRLQWWIPDGEVSWTKAATMEANELLQQVLLCISAFDSTCQQLLQHLLEDVSALSSVLKCFALIFVNITSKSVNSIHRNSSSIQRF